LAGFAIIALAGGVMATMTYATTALLAGRLPAGSPGALASVVVAGGMGVIAYTAMLMVFRLPEAQTLASAIRARLPG
jgi:hypothetical protein